MSYGDNAFFDPSVYPSRQWSLPNLAIIDKSVNELVKGIIEEIPPIWKAHDIDLNQNKIGDEGFKVLVEMGSGSGLGSKDEEKPFVQRLFVGWNSIQLVSPGIAPLFARHISRLHTLSIAGNPLDNGAFINLFSDANTASCFKELRLLDISECGLNAGAAEALAGWLTSGGTELIELRANRNLWGGEGCDHIVGALSKSAGNSALLMVELYPGDTPGGRARLPVSVRSILPKCLMRNRELRLASRRAGWGILGPARALLASSALENIPNEIWVEIFRPVGRWAALTPLSGDSEPGSAAGFNNKEAEKEIIRSGIEPLTTLQLLKIIQYAGSRETLNEEIEWANENKARWDKFPSHKYKGDLQNREGTDDDISQSRLLALQLGGVWTEITDEGIGKETWMQKVVCRMGCGRFEGVTPVV